MYLYRSANLIVPNSDAFRINLVKRGISNDKQIVIPNGSNLKLFDHKKSGKSVRKQFNLEKKFIIGYIGTHGMAHNLDFILDCVTEIKDPKYHFLFVGDGAEKKKLVNQVKRLNIQNVTFVDPIQKDKVPYYLAATDVSLVPLKKSDVFKTVIPSKIFEAAAMQTPILLGVEGEAQKIIEEFDAGICFEPENEHDFLQKLELLKHDKKLYAQKAKNGARLAKAYNRKRLANKMLWALKDLA
jgi:glycosyltransferase involved in cell wall biosynthesis